MRLFFAFFIAVTLLFPTSVVNAQLDRNVTICVNEKTLDVKRSSDPSRTCSAFGDDFEDATVPGGVLAICIWKSTKEYIWAKTDPNGTTAKCYREGAVDTSAQLIYISDIPLSTPPGSPAPTQPGTTPPPGEGGGGGGNQPPGCNPKTYTERLVTFDRLKALVKTFKAPEVITLINKGGVDFKLTPAQTTELKGLKYYDSSIIVSVNDNLKCTTIAPSPTPTKGGGGGTKPTPTKPGGGGGGTDDDGFKPGEPPSGKVQGRCEDGFHEDGVLCIPNPVVKGPDSVQSLAAKLISYLLYLSGIIAVIMIIIGGYQIMTAAGDASQAASGRKTLTNAIIGLVIIVLSYTIINVVIGFIT